MHLYHLLTIVTIPLDSSDRSDRQIHSHIPLHISLSMKMHVCPHVHLRFMLKLVLHTHLFKTVHEDDLLPPLMSFIPKTAPDIATRLRTSTKDIRLNPLDYLPHVLSLQNVVSWLVELWKRWPHAYYTCIASLLEICTALHDLDADSYHITRISSFGLMLCLSALARESSSP